MRYNSRHRVKTANSYTTYNNTNVQSAAIYTENSPKNKLKENIYVK